MNQVRLLSREPANVLLFNAICAVCPSKELLETFNIEAKGEDTEATVEVRVNGVLVPFVGALDQAVKTILAKHKDLVREAAVRLLTESPLAGLQASIQDAEEKIRAALAAVPEL